MDWFDWEKQVLEDDGLVHPSSNKASSFDFDWTLWTPEDEKLLRSIANQKAAGNIEELCPSEKRWHFVSKNEHGVRFIESIKDEPAIVLHEDG